MEIPNSWVTNLGRVSRNRALMSQIIYLSLKVVKLVVHILVIWNLNDNISTNREIQKSSKFTDGEPVSKTKQSE